MSFFRIFSVMKFPNWSSTLGPNHRPLSSYLRAVRDQRISAESQRKGAAYDPHKRRPHLMVLSPPWTVPNHSSLPGLWYTNRLSDATRGTFSNMWMRDSTGRCTSEATGER